VAFNTVRMLIPDTLEGLKVRREEIQVIINESNDYFLKFGWVKQLEEIDKKIEEFKLTRNES